MYYLSVSDRIAHLKLPEESPTTDKTKKNTSNKPTAAFSSVPPSRIVRHLNPPIERSREMPPPPPAITAAATVPVPIPTTTHAAHKKKGGHEFRIPESIRGRPRANTDSTMRDFIEVPPRLREKSGGSRMVSGTPGKEHDAEELHTIVRSFVGLVPRTPCGVCGHVFLLPHLTCRISGKSIQELKRSWGNKVMTTLGHLYSSKEVCCFCAQFFGVYVKEYDAFADQVEIFHQPVVRSTEHVVPKPFIEPTASPPKKGKIKDKTTLAPLVKEHPAGGDSPKVPRSSATSSTLRRSPHVRRDPSGAVPSRVVLTPDDLPVMPLRAVGEGGLPHQPLPPMFHQTVPEEEEAPSCDPVLPEELIDDSADAYECLIIAVTEFSKGLVALPNYVGASLDRLRHDLEGRGANVTALYNHQVNVKNVDAAVLNLCEKITRRTLVFVVVVGIAVCSNVRGVQMLSSDLHAASAVSLDSVFHRLSAAAPRTVAFLDVLNVRWPTPRPKEAEGIIVQSSESIPGVLLHHLCQTLRSDKLSVVNDVLRGLTEACRVDIDLPSGGAADPGSVRLPEVGEAPKVAGTYPLRRLLVGTSSITRQASTLRVDDWMPLCSPQGVDDVRWGVLVRCWLGHITEARANVLINALGATTGRFEFHSQTHTLLIVRSPISVMEQFCESFASYAVRSLHSSIIDDVYTFQMYEIREGSEVGEDSVYGACFLQRSLRPGALHVDVVV